MRDRFFSAIRVAAACCMMQISSAWRTPIALVGTVIYPVVLLIILLNTREATPAEASRLVIAIVLTSLWGVTVWNAGGILRREMYFGTLAINFTSVHSPYLVLLGKCLGATMGSAGMIIASATATLVVLGVPVNLERPGWVVVGVVIVVFSGTSLGMLIACLFLLTRHGQAISSAVTYPVMIMGGLLIPTTVLPPALMWVPAIISLRWINEFLIAAAAGATDLAALGNAAMLTLGYFAAAAHALSRVTDRARSRGTIELV